MSAQVFDVPLPGGRIIAGHRTSGQGRPMVLLHGLLDDRTGWDPLVRRTPHPTIALDLPGFGASSLPVRPRIDAYADAVIEALEWLGVAHATVVGHSLGGAVATAVAERSPAIDGLALLAPAGFGPRRLAELASRPGVNRVARAALPLGLANPLVVTAAYSTLVAHRRLPPADLVHRLRRRAFRSGAGTGMALEAIAAAGRSPRAFHRRAVGFEGPVSVLWGDRDALVPIAHAEGVRRALPQASLEVWEAMGHHPQRERPEALAHFLGRAVWRSRARATAARRMRSETAA